MAHRLPIKTMEGAYMTNERALTREHLISSFQIRQERLLHLERQLVRLI